MPRPTQKTFIFFLICCIFGLSCGFLAQPKTHVGVSRNPIRHTITPSMTSRSSNTFPSIPFSTINGNEKEADHSLMQLLDSLTNLFPVWVLASSLIGFRRPQSFTWFNPYVTNALCLTMMSMGLTLTLDDFKNVLKTPKWVAIGFLAQYTIMPLSAAFFAKIFQLPPPLATGLILVGCSPGGTASNLVTMIAKADLALSVLMTAASTAAAVFMTPFLSSLLAGSYVSVKAADLVGSTLNVVLLPVILGISLNTKFPKITSKIGKFTPFLSVVLVSLICGTVSAGNAGFRKGLEMMSMLQLIGAVVCLHTSGFGVGYFFAKFFGATPTQARTISIETGMQNSALACVLAQHFPNPLTTAFPGAISATTHSVIGSALASIWRSLNVPKKLKKKRYGLSSWRYNLSSNI